MLILQEAGDKLLFPQYMVEEKPSKKPKKKLSSSKTEKNYDKGAVALCDITTVWGCASQDSETAQLPKSVKYRRNQRHKVWDQFDEYDSHRLRYVQQVFEKIKDYR